jgi:hypothetical protein
MVKKYSKRGLSLFFSLVFIIALFSGLTITASAAYTPTGTMTALWNSGSPTAAVSGTYYSIGSATEMGYFDSYVNGSYNTSGVTFYLTGNVALSGTWTPVGGACGVTGTIPSGIGFSGVFDGQSHTISGLSVSATVTSSTTTGYGLFGFVNGGVVGNLLVSGSVTVSGAGQDIGGIVGYTNYNLYNCISSVTVSASGCSNVGGVAGAVENTTTSNLNVKYCANNNAVTGSKRVGGVIGGSYSGTSNHIYIDRCYNVGNVTSTSTSKTYAGGVDGYCCGVVTNCYNTGSLTAGGTSVKCYIGGIAGILVHYSTQPSSMAYCYSTASFSNIWSGYAEYLYGASDTTTVTVSNCYWVVPTSGALGYDQGAYATQTNVRAQVLSALTTTLMGSAYTGSAPVTLNFSNAHTDLTAGTPSTSSDNDLSYMIFVDGSASTNGDGSQSSPYNNIADALSDLDSTYNIIYIVGQVTISADTTISSSVTGAAIERSCTYSGDLFDVTSGTATVSGITIDGNKANFTNASGALFRVEGGTLSISSGVTLQNNSTQTNGGAIHIESGSATLSGSITGNNAQNGGGVAMFGGAFTVNAGGSISGNTSHTYGAGVYYVSSGSTYVNNGTVSDSVYAA